MEEFAKVCLELCGDDKGAMTMVATKAKHLENARNRPFSKSQ